MNTQTNDWYWTIEGGLAVLHDGHTDKSVRYNGKNVRSVLAHVTSSRHEYATEEAWQRQLRIFSEGVALLSASVQAASKPKTV